MKLIYRDQITMAFWGGYLTALLHNNYHKRKDLPPLLLCMKEFRHLHTLFGRYYTLLRDNKNTNHALNMYEKFTSQVGIPSELVGTFPNFMQGYCTTIKRQRLTTDDSENLNLLNIEFN